jgi:hypothetical protein
MHVPRSTGGVAGAPASVGRVKPARLLREYGAPPMLRLTAREVADTAASEQHLIEHIVHAYRQAGLAVQRSLLVNYYVSLKSNPFVVLAGAEGTGKSDFIQVFAHAMLGRESRQYTVVPMGSSWHVETGEGSYYRGVHDRFASMRFLETLHEAAAPHNSSKLYMVCFQRLHPGEIRHYFAELLHVDESGAKRLNLPGSHSDHLPLLPPNVVITGTVDTSADPATLDQIALRHAGLIVFPETAQSALHPLSIVAPLPVGYQRLWVRAAITDIAVATERLARLLGRTVDRLSPSPQIRNLFWREGRALSSRHLHDLTLYIANSFDERGVGLFHPHPLRNAQAAYDAQVIQRVLWRLQRSANDRVEYDLRDHLEQLCAPYSSEQTERAAPLGL